MSLVAALMSASDGPLSQPVKAKQKMGRVVIREIFLNMRFMRALHPSMVDLLQLESKITFRMPAKYLVMSASGNLAPREVAASPYHLNASAITARDDLIGYSGSWVRSDAVAKQYQLLEANTFAFCHN
jgi:hypothetical protein